MSSLLALHPITRRSLLGGIAASSALVMLHPFAARAAANQAHLRIMETTDIHVHVFPYDYYADKPNDTMGLARTASIIDTIRAEAAAGRTVVFSTHVMEHAERLCDRILLIAQGRAAFEGTVRDALALAPAIAVVETDGDYDMAPVLQPALGSVPDAPARPDLPPRTL